MRLVRFLSALLLPAAALALQIEPLSAAAKKSPLRSNRVVAVYDKATAPEHRALEKVLRERRALERAAEFLGMIRLPRRLTLRAASCDGDVNAYYEDDEIKVCYEYFEAILKRANAKELPAGTTAHNLVVGAVADAFFHEGGHAVFDMLEIPVFGREEDAADQFSAFLMLQFAKNDAAQLIVGAAFWFVNEYRDSAKQPDLATYAGEHSLPAQRFFNYMCLAYGSDPKFFAVVLEKAKLTKERAEWCEGEYKQVRRAFQRLIMPYVDQQVVARLRKRRLFGLEPVK